MARINIEDSIFKDKRFIELCILCGGADKALGELVFVWIEAQNNFLEKGEIPNEKYTKMKLSENVIKVGLAHRTETGVIVSGQEKQFEWLRQKSEAGRSGGKRSVHKRIEKYGNSKPFKKHEATRSECFTNDEAATKRHEASYSYSYSNSLNNINTITSKVEKSISNEISTPISELVNAWNNICTTLPKVQKLTESRKRKIKTQLKEFPDLQYWNTVFKKLSSSKFHTGENDRNWKADFDWIIKPDKHPKIYEMKNDNNKFGSAYETLKKMREKDEELTDAPF